MPATGPTLSVVIPTYNRSRELERALDSLRGQSLADFEVIVVDDGSEDDTEHVVAACADSRVRYHRQEHRGRSRARNTGVELARGSVITFLDSDDEAMPGWLETFSRAFTAPDTGIVCCGFVRRIEESDGTLIKRELHLPRVLGAAYQRQTGRFNTGSFAVQRDLFRAVGGYESQLELGENTDLALRLIPECLGRGLKVIAVAEHLVEYHTHRSIDSPEAFRVRLESARFMLQRHGELYLRVQPRTYASYCAIAGVNAARLGRVSEARGHLLRAIRVRPGELRHYGRLGLALLPPLARRVWLRG